MKRLVLFDVMLWYWTQYWNAEKYFINKRKIDHLWKLFNPPTKVLFAGKVALTFHNVFNIEGGWGIMGSFDRIVPTPIETEWPHTTNPCNFIGCFLLDWTEMENELPKIDTIGIEVTILWAGNLHNICNQTQNQKGKLNKFIHTKNIPPKVDCKMPQVVKWSSTQ